MAARKSPRLDAQWRERIKTSMLLNRLSDFVESKVEMTPHQVTAALGLLRKVCPDLSAQDLTIDHAQPFALIPEVVQDLSKWQQVFKPALPKPETEH